MTTSDADYQKRERELREAYSAAAIAWRGFINPAPEGYKWIAHPFIIGMCAQECVTCGRIFDVDNVEGKNSRVGYWPVGPCWSCSARAHR